MLAAVASESSAGSRNVSIRETYKSADLWVNSRNRFVRPASSSLFNDKENISGQTKENCFQDYFPCSCSLDTYNRTLVSCRNVSVETVRDVFLRVNEPEIYQLELYPLADAANTISIPADLLGNTSVTSYRIIGVYAKYQKLLIDPSAFRSSQNSLVNFYVSNFDFGLQKDFSFLDEFNRLDLLEFLSVNNLTAFQYLPPLPSLQRLYIQFCPDLNQITFPDLSPAKLKLLFLRDNQISDKTADKIVASLAVSTSADSLEDLVLNANSLTRIPSQLGSAFPKQTEVYLADNIISHIPSSSLTFAYPLSMLDLQANQLKTIESGAFKGRLLRDCCASSSQAI